MINPQLENKVAIVSGANHGIGGAIAIALAAQGVKVFITYKLLETGGDIPDDSEYVRNRQKNASEVINTIIEAGGIAQATEIDLSIPENIPHLFDLAEEAFGAVDIVVNNAAHWTPSTFIPKGQELANKFSVSWMNNDIPTFSPDLHDAAFAVNARGTAHMMTEFAKRNLQRGATWGRVINISTDSARSFPSEATYGASKFALESYSRSAASELGQFGITVNIISPGPIQTGYITEDMEKGIAEYTPLRRVGYPDDVADVAVFLASEQARWVTGQIIYVGGGHRM